MPNLMHNNLPFISNADIERMLNMDDIIKICNNIFSRLSDQSLCSPKKVSLTLPGDSEHSMRWINSMPAYLVNEKVVGIKWVSICSSNKQHGLPTTNGLIIINNLETGVPLALLDASLITHFRTAASILLAAINFSPINSQIATIIGPGQEGRYTALFLNHQFHLKKINVFSRDEESYLDFKKFILNRTNDTIEIQRIMELHDAVSESDLIISSSTSMQPILNKSSFIKNIKASQFLCGLTAFNDISSEILDVVDNLIFDDGENAMNRIEEVSKIKFSNLGFNNKIYNMSSLGKFKANSGINLYLPVGISAMDIAIANYMFNCYVAC